MRLNKSTSHAVRILIDCAKAEGRLIKVADIAKRLDITQQNAFKIVHLLSKAGFLTSVRGRHGGVRLARSAALIRIGDVVRSIETLGQEEKESGSRGSLHRIVDDALDAFISVLDQHTLEDMAGASQASPGAGIGRPLRQNALAWDRNPLTARTAAVRPGAADWLTRVGLICSNDGHGQVAKMCGVSALDRNLRAFKS